MTLGRVIGAAVPILFALIVVAGLIWYARSHDKD
jgi:hypothetical protein